MTTPRTRGDGARILVTGSEGFVGKHLRSALEQRGADCIGVDMPGSGSEIEVDLSVPSLDVGEFVKRAGAIDGLIYMAARITRGSSVDSDARRNLRTIAEAPVRIAEALGTKVHVVLCSTFKMYGPAATNDPVDPAHPPQSPDPHSYGSAKFLAERLMEISAARTGQRFAVVRPSCIYGPGQHAHNAIPRFLAAILDGKAPTVFGKGRSIRDDVLASDLAWLLVEAALQRATGSYHAAGERERSILDVARVCCAAAKVEGLGLFEPLLDENRNPKWWIDQSFSLSSSRRLGYQPTSLLEGVRAQIRWMIAGGDLLDTWRFIPKGPGAL